MNFNEYQEKAQETCLPSAQNLYYLALKLGAEAGEVQQKIAKAIRDAGLEPGKEEGSACFADLRQEVYHELGDVLWYVAVLAEYFFWDLESIALGNLDKLKKRAAEGKIQGSGDDR